MRNPQIAYSQKKWYFLVHEAGVVVQQKNRGLIMKKGPRCPVCGSTNIKELTEGGPRTDTGSLKKEDTDNNAVPTGNATWKCGDCYRKFAEPYEKSQ